MSDISIARVYVIVMSSDERAVLIKMKIGIMIPISGFLTVGIMCRLEISGLGLVSRWYHDTAP